MMKKPIKIKNALAAVLLLSLTSCATTPSPAQAISATDSAIRRAEANRFADEPLPELRAAREKQAAARAAEAQREYLLATRLTEQARLDAELAITKSEVAKLQFDVDGMKKGNAALKQQALRNAISTAPVAIPAPIDPATGEQ